MTTIKPNRHFRRRADAIAGRPKNGGDTMETKLKHIKLRREQIEAKKAAHREKIGTPAKQVTKRDQAKRREFEQRQAKKAARRAKHTRKELVAV